MRDLLRALSLLTTLPVRATWDERQAPGRVMAAYPLAGAVLGLLLAALAGALAWSGLARAAPLLPAALITAAWAALTGALHLDGWADCCDALFVPVGRERRLEIMKDPRLGSFGGAGLVLLLLIKLAAVQGVLTVTLPAGAGTWETVFSLLPWLAAPVLARWAVVVAAWGFPPAKAEGMAAFFRRGLGRREIVLATLTVLPLVIALGALGPLLWAGAALAMWAMARLAVTQLGGLTGDVYGAITELSEVVILVVVCFWSL